MPRLVYQINFQELLLVHLGAPNTEQKIEKLLGDFCLRNINTMKAVSRLKKII